MEDSLRESENSFSRLNKVLGAINENVSALSDNIEEFENILSQPFTSTNDLFIPQENHKDLKSSLEILCRLPRLLFLFNNNCNAVGSMDISTFIQKYDKEVTAINETNEKLAEMVMKSEKLMM